MPKNYENLKNWKNRRLRRATVEEQKELEGLAMPPMPGPKGQDIYENVSKLAWEEWQNQQTMLINEKHLSLMDVNNRKYLQAQMDRFFNNEPFVDQRNSFNKPIITNGFWLWDFGDQCKQHLIP